MKGYHCCICGHPIMPQRPPLCRPCQRGVQIFQEVFGETEALAHTALKFLELHWSEDADKEAYTEESEETHLPSVGTRRCARCEREKPISQFYISPAGQIHSYCRPCQSAYNSARHNAKYVQRSAPLGPQNKKRSSRNARR